MNISRRDFVKCCGAGAATIGLGNMGNRAALAVPAGSGGREILPIPDTEQPYPSALHGKDVQPRPAKPLRPPEGAPNVVIILIDDMGFGASSAFGGPINMPALERVAADGLKYTRFHTTALCSPTRQALLTGRNHHSVGMGSITETATTAPGYNSIRPNSAATIAETLRLNGYSTAAYGKMHQTPVWEVSTSGPFDRWPTGEGFEEFYGFLGGETNQWAPTLYHGTTPVELPYDPEYHLTPDLVNHAVAWVQAQHKLTPDKPFFVYLSFDATHAPHHVPAEWSDKYKGKFDQGWDAVRAATLARQKELGVVPQDCQLTARSEGIAAWDDLSDDERTVAARLMEVYAGFAEHTDHHAGRFLDALEAMGVLDNTLVFYIAGDNGASPEGLESGTYNELMTLNDLPHSFDEVLAHYDDIGTVRAYNHYPVGWAHAMDCPYQWTKQVASHWGGTRTGMAVRWPQGIRTRGEVRHQWHHVIDVAPTILSAAGLPEPVQVHGVTQKPIEGVGMNYTFDDAAAPDRHVTQYFEMFGNRGIYHQGGRTTMTFYPGMAQLAENTVPNVKNKSHTITAEIEAPADGADGVIIAQGGRFGGWSLYVKGGVLTYVHNYVGIEEYPVVATAPLPAGRTTVRYEFTYQGDGEAGKGGTGALYIDDKQVGEGRIGQTVPYIFSLDETLDIARDLATPVTDDYAMGDNAFNGTIYTVTIDIGEDAVAYHEPLQVIHNRLMAG